MSSATHEESGERPASIQGSGMTSWILMGISNLFLIGSAIINFGGGSAYSGMGWSFFAAGIIGLIASSALFQHERKLRELEQLVQELKGLPPT